MAQSSYKYDVAFSFLAQDEPLATEINDLLQDRLTTFLYSKRQGEIAGTDGEKMFDRIFGEESRVVAVLYRSGWGETPWTRIEETAIRNRAYEHGYDFTIFIPLDEPPTVPKWLPKARLWVGLKRWGTNGAASVIEARALELGGEAHEETAQARAARLERSMRFAERREHFRNSVEGVSAANEEFDRLGQHLGRLITEIPSSIHLELKRAEKLIVILGLGFGMSIEWHRRYTNSLDDTKLAVHFWNRHPPFPGIQTFEPPRRLSTIEFDFDLTSSGAYVWRQSSSGRREFDTAELADFLLRHHMDEAQRRKPSLADFLDDEN